MNYFRNSCYLKTIESRHHDWLVDLYNDFALVWNVHETSKNLPLQTNTWCGMSFNIFCGNSRPSKFELICKSNRIALYTEVPNWDPWINFGPILSPCIRTFLKPEDLKIVKAYKLLENEIL